MLQEGTDRTKPDDGHAQELLGLAERFGGIGSWQVDVSSQRVSWSARVCAIHGETPDTAPETLEAALTYVHREDREAAAQAFCAALDGNEPLSLTHRLRLASGDVRWVEMNGVLRHGGATDTLLGTIRDVTEERATQAELTASVTLHRRLRDAIERLQTGFVLYDAEDRLVLCNAKYLELYRLSADNRVPGTHFEDIVRHGLERGQYPEAAGCEEAWLAERMEQHRNPGLPFEQQLPDGRWLRVHEVALPDGGRAGISIDVTETKRMEGRLTAAAKEALSANRLKDRFLANMSHELRTPLNAIIGFAQVIEMMGKQQDTAPEIPEYAGDIHSAGQHLLGIIEDIFSLSRMDAGQGALDLAPTDVHDILDDTRSMTGALARQHGKHITVDDGGCGALAVIADKTKITQVMVNLVTNAVKYSGDAEDISVSADLDDGDRIVLTVADRGPGIPLHLQDRIFERFERLDATKRAIEGVGIGLAIAKDLVRAMNGEIGVKSEEGRGATFWITLPLAQNSIQKIAV